MALLWWSEVSHIAVEGYYLVLTYSFGFGFGF